MAYSMPLNEVLVHLQISSEEQIHIESLAIDSRKVEPGALFFAYPGMVYDGRDYMEAAQAAGAAAIVYEADHFLLPESITIPAFPVDQLQSMVGFVASEFYGQPSVAMQVFGVTGTNGKTTCCYLLTQALTKLGLQAAVVGTTGVGKLDNLADSSHTTPDPIAVHRLLAEFRDSGITQVCMEVSSHALDQGRVNGVQFFCTLFTNLSHDHLDYHGNMQRYASAKQRLFTDFASELTITNINDSMGANLVNVAGAEFIVSYGQNGDVYADDVVLDSEGIRMQIEGNGVAFKLATPLIGKVNISNIEMLVAALLALSTPIGEIQHIVAGLESAPGRMELYTAEHKAQVVVDYAHTPDALEKALVSVQEHCEGELWCVFGCGGERDRAKRSAMGVAAEKYADRLVITNDNPRSEEGSAIAAEIVAGMTRDAQIILDRKEAIVSTIGQASSLDWVLVAGKGHETTQQIGDEYFPFSDREHVKAALGEGA